MRSTGIWLTVLGVLVAILGLANHLALHFNLVAHFDTIIIAIALVFVVIGAIMAMMGRSSASHSGTAGASRVTSQSQFDRPRTWDDLTSEQKAASQHAAWQQQQGRDPWGHPKR